MKSKGQTMVFEQVMLFSLGVIILMSSFALFTMYQNFYVAETSQDQITQIKEYVVSNILEICENEEYNSTIILSIPRTIGGSFYRISLSDAGLNITQEAVSFPASDFSSLYGLNQTFTFSGMVVSDNGRVVLYKSGNSLILNRNMI